MKLIEKSVFAALVCILGAMLIAATPIQDLVFQSDDAEPGDTYWNTSNSTLRIHQGESFINLN